MSSLTIGSIVFACLFVGALLGMFIRTILPAHHLSPESRT
jgi:H+/Cl- antiporter ClcA